MEPLAPDEGLGEMKSFYDGHQIPVGHIPDRDITGDVFAMFWRLHACHAWHKFRLHGGLITVHRIHESHSFLVSPGDQRGCGRAWPLHGGFSKLF